MVKMSAMQLLVFHRLDYDFFRRLVRDLGQEQERTRWIMALWLWLESEGHHEFVRRLSALPGPVVLRFIDEAVTCLDRLAGNGDVAASANDRLTCTNAFLSRKIDVSFFDTHREEAVKGLTSLYKDVCRIIFYDVDDDYDLFMPANVRSALMGRSRIEPPREEMHAALMGGARIAPPREEMYAALLEGLRIAPPREEMYAAALLEGSRIAPPREAMHAALLGGSRIALPKEEVMTLVTSPRHTPAPTTSALNPMASPWTPTTQSCLPEDHRSLFITFSRGYPISKDDIMEFFNSRYGPCVESVMMERPAPGQLPVYGRVVLRSPTMITAVLNGQQTAKFIIKGRHLWARIYVPSSSSRTRFYMA